MQYLNTLVLNAESLGSDVTSEAVQIQQYFGYAVAVVITGGTAAGTLKLQGSCDVPQTPLGVQPDPSTFVDIGGTSAAIAGATNALYNMSNVHYNWVRIVYTRSGGTGSITARINAKGL